MGVKMQPFTTDGCSLFPDHSLISNTDWCGCCIAHDLAYWRGGTTEERQQADQALATCVYKATDSRALSDLMYAGVRAGGGPYFYTSYRWGYGWPYGRGYQPLTDKEAAMATILEKQYRAAHEPLTCQK